ncbi:MAG TPA: dihydroorotase, partial [Clostridia bacterium]|nr:dihydroorotase [Clostridia bacterium]
MSTLIKNGILVDSQNLTMNKCDILIEDGKISYISDSITPARVAQVIDVSGFIVMPGLVDMHAHLREPGYEK